MSNETKKGAMPRLRFPEFWEAGEWEAKKLGAIGEIITGKTPSTLDADLWGGEILFITPTDIDEDSKYQFHAQRTVSNTAVVKTLPPGSIVYTCIASIGKIAITTKSSCTNQQINSIVVRDGIDNEFVYYALVHITPYIKSKPATSTLPIINKSEFSAFAIPVPSLLEQQKIAACLSSLDELIAAEVEKGGALKAHKRGLMQGLFPREGETVPRVRFAGFEGEWVETTLGQSLVRHPEYGIGAPAVPYSESLPTYLRITDISEDGHFIRNQKVSVGREVTEENYLSEGDIVFARTGASVGKSYKYRVEDGRLVFAGFLIRIRPDEKKLASEFLLQFLSTEQYWRWVAFSSTRSGQPGINGNEYSLMPLPLPPTLAEQQKIAAILSSLDDLITAQSQKTDALKEHKRGLMQALFPVGTQSVK